VCPSWLRRQA